MWKVQPAGFLEEAFVDVDGTIAGTYGECKQGMDLSYKGIWGYAPLVVSLANTKEVLYVINRPGNAASQRGSVEWIDRAVALVRPVAGTVTIRGDTDFSHTEQLDRWDGEGTQFIVGMDAHPKLVKLAEALGTAAWRAFEREPQYEILTEPRPKAFRYKEQVVVERRFENKKLVGEALAQIEYQPHHCHREYRVIILRKNITMQIGEKALFDDVRYFFYITNRKDKPAQIVGLANGRCDQENVIEQLKNGVNAMRMPVNDLVSNWAYMVMAALAWNLKAWYGLLTPNRERGLELVRMEFRRFLHAIVLLPCQIVRTGPAGDLPYPGVQPLVEGFLCDVGTSAPNDADGSKWIAPRSLSRNGGRGRTVAGSNQKWVQKTLRDVSAWLGGQQAGPEGWFRHQWRDFTPDSEQRNASCR